MESTEKADRLRDAHEVYEHYVRPLEQEHRGKFAAVAPDGTVTLAPTLHDAVVEAGRHPDPGNFIFKIGEFVVGSIR